MRTAHFKESKGARDKLFRHLSEERKRFNMKFFEILFHGSFFEMAQDGAKNSTLKDFEHSGFYTSRVIDSSSSDAAITRGKELIRRELDQAILDDRERLFVDLEVEESKEIAFTEGIQINRTGFTLY
jgi:hypothetical protein